MMLLTQGLGDGTPASTGQSTTPPAFNFSQLPGQLIGGAEKWLHPSDAVSTIKGAFTGGLDMSTIGTVVGVALVPLLLLAVVKGHHRR